MKKSLFTLVELLVVVAIIGVLASLLLPVLGKARKQARRVVCNSQMRQLALKITIYTDDNEQYYPYATQDNDEIQWDDLINYYLSTSEKKEKGLDESFTKAANDKLYICPSDEVERNGGDLTRSYSLNSGSNWSVTNLQNLNGIATIHGTSARVNDIPAPSELLMMGEKYHKHNRRGYNNHSVLGTLANFGGKPGAHGNLLKYNYVFVDGHTEFLLLSKSYLYQDR
jgi:prepilin-type N-terminal cleavage/methylation domain-containing protein/prepilin-type processing-associated H-X9-DG protein